MSFDNVIPILGKDGSTQYLSVGGEGTLDEPFTIGSEIGGISYVSGKSGVDASTETLQSITYEHHEIHAGSHYNYEDYDLSMGSGDIVEFIMTTPDTDQEVHFTFNMSASLGATLELYEGATSVVGGTSLTPRNNNRRSSKTSSVTLVQDPTSLTDGNRASGFLAGGGRVAGFVGRDRERVLARNTAYLVRITSLANSNEVSCGAEWYEHTPKN